MTVINRQKVLEVRHLQTQFRTEHGIVRSVDDVSFRLDAGEILGIVGESGCGKSVTSFSIMGLIEAPGEIAGGEIWLEEQELTKLSKRQLRKLQGKDMAMIFQEPLTSLNPLLTVGLQISEVLTRHKRLSKREVKEQSIAMLRQVGIPRPEQVYHAYPHELSGGMRQRVMIAIAISCGSKLLIADEPTTALDVTIQAQILKLMKELRDNLNTSIMLITHDLGVVAEMADRVIVMYAGQVVEEGDVYEIYRSPKHPYTKGLMNSTPKIEEVRRKLESIPGTVPVLSNMPSGCRFHPRCPVARDKCRAEAPQMKLLRPGVQVRCWLHQEGEVELNEEFKRRAAAGG
ncbi:oligopeptide/dipeptide ABC transporter ATP-binding protein [Paenibacillus daejeonensis]|uniref:ABC transporter ATP-binding protein n=1 Tax=Paenibacillus daejeonensis TaxID=135193 RepID=UPI00035CB90D